MSESITAVAIKQPDGRVWQAPRPQRHHHLIRTIATATGVTPVLGEQGFVTSSGRFVSRIDARRLAEAAGQVDKYVPSELYSEDLW
jgi:hypothetical protein